MKFQASFSRFSPISCKLNTLQFLVESEDLQRYKKGALVQEAFPYLSVEEREFLISGLLPGEEQASVFGEEE